MNDKCNKLLLDSLNKEIDNTYDISKKLGYDLYYKIDVKHSIIIKTKYDTYEVDIIESNNTIYWNINCKDNNFVYKYKSLKELIEVIKDYEKFY